MRPQQILASSHAVTRDPALVAQPGSFILPLPQPLIRRDPPLKRLLDLTLAVLGLLLSAPLCLLVALAIKLEDGGPVLYSQWRWGRGGRKFLVRKFRTMVPDSDRRYGVRQASAGDRRVTRVGRLLRACGMDELPQLVNIVRGEMSLVGPRALAVGETISDGNGRYRTYENVPGYWERLVVRPGLTSLATVYLPKDAPPRAKFRYDLLYIRRRSFWLDLWLITLSFWITFRGRWEARQGKV